jgi:hypothetical protein
MDILWVPCQEDDDTPGSGQAAAAAVVDTAYGELEPAPLASGAPEEPEDLKKMRHLMAATIESCKDLRLS